MLGDAWCAKLTVECGKAYFLPSSIEIGKREFEAIMPALRKALRQQDFQGVTARIARALLVEASWRVPATIVTALARRKGLLSEPLSVH